MARTFRSSSTGVDAPLEMGASRLVCGLGGSLTTPPFVLGSFSLVIVTLTDWLESQGKQEGKTDSETQKERPAFLAGGNLPEPPPM